MMTRKVEFVRVRSSMGWRSFLVNRIFRLLTQSAQTSFASSFAAFIAAGPRQESHQNDERDDCDYGADLIP